MQFHTSGNHTKFRKFFKSSPIPCPFQNCFVHCGAAQKIPSPQDHRPAMKGTPLYLPMRNAATSGLISIVINSILCFELFFFVGVSKAAHLHEIEPVGPTSEVLIQRDMQVFTVHDLDLPPGGAQSHFALCKENSAHASGHSKSSPGGELLRNVTDNKKRHFVQHNSGKKQNKG